MWCSSGGVWHRHDYVMIPADLMPAVIDCFVDSSIDLSTVREDHRDARVDALVVSAKGAPRTVHRSLP